MSSDQFLMGASYRMTGLAILLMTAMTAPAFAQGAEGMERPVDIIKLMWNFGNYRGPIPIDTQSRANDDARISGKPFDITIPAKPSGMNNEICGGTPYYGYSAKDGKFSVEYASGRSLNKENMLMPHAWFSVTCSVRNSDRTMSNALGVKINVHTKSETNDALEAINVSTGLNSGHLWQQVMDGRSADHLAQRLYVHVRGVIGSSSPLVKCNDYHEAPTLDFPYQTSMDQCVMQVTVSDVELVDGWTKKILDSFSP